MSTTGKVLVVLVTIVTIVWIVMFAGITELNKNWEKAILAQQEQTRKVEEQAVAEKALALAARDETALEQSATGEALAVLRETISTLQQKRSLSLEYSSRMKFLQEKSEASEKGAKLDAETRLQERDEMKKELAAREGDVEKLRRENQELMADLAQKREKFKTILRANQEKLRDMIRKVAQ